MKRVRALFLIGVLISVLLGGGCKPETEDREALLARAARAELRVVTLEASLAKLKDVQGTQELSETELYDNLTKTKDDLAVAMETLVELESENSNLEKRLQQMSSQVESLQQRLAEKGRDLKELETLNGELTSAVEQLERQVRVLEVEPAASLGPRVDDGNLGDERP